MTSKLYKLTYIHHLKLFKLFSVGKVNDCIQIYVLDEIAE